MAPSTTRALGALAAALIAMPACTGKRKAPPDRSAAPTATADAAPAATATADAAAPAPPPTAAATDAAAAVDPAAASLRGRVPLAFAVSSLVKNPSISPADLVDGSLDTAWNSRTGELVGAWIAVRVPATAHVTGLRMTIGATAPATAEGDPFTMNHRISRVRVTRDGAPIGEFDLDPAVRTAQALPVDGPGGDYKVEVLATVAGSKPRWREIVVSELDVLGTAPAGATAPPPTVAIGSLDAAPPADDDALPLVALAPFATQAEACAALHVDAARCVPVEHDPSFPTLAPPPIAVPTGWTRVALVGGGDAGACALVVEADGALFAGAVGRDCLGTIVEPQASALVDAIPGDPPELLLRLRHAIRRDTTVPAPVLDEPDLSYEEVRVCGRTAAGVPGCTEELPVAGISEDTVGDDPEPVPTTAWSRTVAITAGAMVVRKAKGQPSYDYPEALEPGRYKIRP